MNRQIIEALQGIKDSMSSKLGQNSKPSTAIGQEEVLNPKPKPKKVVFDKSTGSPFEAVFSERGFLIEDTRMSFEEIETAISKNYNIVLNGGKGLVLDAVKMQKLLKYKDLL